MDAYDSKFGRGKRGHLTNANIQKANNLLAYNQEKESTRRSFDHLEPLLHSTNNLNTVRCQFQKALVMAVQAVRQPILTSAERCPHCFSLLGADFIIDDTTNNNVWISEIQSGPGLPTNTATTKLFFTRMLPTVVDLVNEIDEKRKQQLPLWPLQKRGQFQLIIHEDSTVHVDARDVMSACSIV